MKNINVNVIKAPLKTNKLKPSTNKTINHQLTNQ